MPDESTLQELLVEIQRWFGPDLGPWVVVAAVMAAALVAHMLLWRLVMRTVRNRRGLLARVVPRLRRPSRLALLVVTAFALVSAAVLPPGWIEVLTRVALATLIAIIGWITLIVLDVAVERYTGRLELDAEDNLNARKQVTQVRVLQRAGRLLIFLLTLGLVLATFESVRQYGVSLFASAGAAGLVLGFAARPVLANLIAGVQIALTQPIRLDDVVIVEGEWGWVEEITSTYVVVRIWDLRRLIVPLSHFIEKPFQNWTRESATIIGSVFWYLDWTAPIAEMREKLREIVENSPHWDGNVVNLQVTETDSDVIHVRALMTARTSPKAWDLRCEVRERMVEWLQREHPGALPRTRAELRDGGEDTRDEGPAAFARKPPRVAREEQSGVPKEAVPVREGGEAPTKAG